jgi:hypothetical protein
MTIDTFFAKVSKFSGLRDSICARVEQLGTTRTCLDEITGLPSGYCGKLLAQGEANQKRIGPLSLDLLLPAVGLKMVLLDDRTALAKVEPMLVPRDASQVRLGNNSRNSKGRKKPKPAATRRPKRPTVKRGRPYLSRPVA